jgi:hypothetical protein
MTTNDVMARLRAADEQDRGEAYRRGQEAGRGWACREARPNDLRRLEELDGAGSDDMISVFDNGQNKGVAWGLYETLHPQEEPDRAAVGAYWESVLGGGGQGLIDDADFARGFVEGALRVWDEVKDKL